MVLANCNKRMSVQGQDESDVIVTAFEHTLKTVVPRVGHFTIVPAIELRNTGKKSSPVYIKTLISFFCWNLNCKQ